MMKRTIQSIPVLGKCLILFALVFSFSAAYAQVLESEERSVSPQLKINHSSERGEGRKRKRDRRGFKFKTRSMDGSGNNKKNPDMGAAFSKLTRLMDADYGDGISALSGEKRPSARAVSNAVSAQEGSIPNSLNTSDYLWQWGQFVDHDVDLTGGVDPAEPADIAVPLGDPFFDPDSTGVQVIEFNRSIYNADTGISTDTPRQQINEITAWVDASNVYGSDIERASALRTNDGTGKLKTSAGELLPFNTEGFPNAGGDSNTLFFAGDVRANEQAALTTIHTLFVREHNRMAEKYKQDHPRWSGDKIYERAKRMVGAQMQVITYNEFLPALLGKDALKPYRGYDKKADGSIMNMFSTAAYRFGHSALSPTLLRLDASGAVIPEGNLPLRDAFFSPDRIINEGGIEPILRGLAAQAHQRIDPLVIDDVRNFLFGPPGAGGFDLASLNIQRGRDHGLRSYNDVREEFGLARAQNFFDISSEQDVVDRLSSVYESVDDVDLWVGGLSEDLMPGAHLGQLFYEIIVMQFEALRDGDRMWYTRMLNKKERREIKRTKLSDIIRRNTDIGQEIPDDVFHLAQ